MVFYDDNGEPRYFGLYAATVVDNADPEKLGRVRVRVDGLIEPSSGWCFPAGGPLGNGSNSGGAYDAPDNGAAVYVQFLAGDVDQPVFFGGWRGQGEVITQTPDKANASKVKIFETSRFLIVLSAIGGSEKILITDKSTNDKIEMTPNKIELKTSTAAIEGSTLVTLGTAAAAMAALKSTPYRAAEDTFLDAICVGVQAALSALALAPAAAALTTAQTAFHAAAPTFLSTQVKNS